MAPSETVPVRIPQHLLDRASELDSEHRAEMIREACERGLEAMERERAAARLSDVRQLAREAVRSDPELKLQILLEASSLLPKRPIVLPFLPVDETHVCGVLDDVPFIRLQPGETEVHIPQIAWMTYTPTNLRIWTESNAEIEVANLRPDSGNGPNLLMPGWHGSSVFRQLGIPLVRHENIASPMNLKLVVRSQQKVRAAISLEAIIDRDSVCNFAIFDREAMDKASRSARMTSLKMDRVLSTGPLIRVPFVGELPTNDHPIACLRATGLNHGTLRVAGIVFEEGQGNLLHTALSSFSIMGGVQLLPHDGWSLAADYAPDSSGNVPALRDYPILRSPNEASITIGRVNDQPCARPYLLLTPA